MSTPLSLYCKLRSISGVHSCILLDADINSEDTDGMYPMDLLFIGNTDEKKVESIMKIIPNTQKLNIHECVFNMYYREYIGKYFEDILLNFNIIK